MLKSGRISSKSVPKWPQESPVPEYILTFFSNVRFCHFSVQKLQFSEISQKYPAWNWPKSPISAVEIFFESRLAGSNIFFQKKNSQNPSLRHLPLPFSIFSHFPRRKDRFLTPQSWVFPRFGLNSKNTPQIRPAISSGRYKTFLSGWGAKRRIRAHGDH